MATSDITDKHSGTNQLIADLGSDDPSVRTNAMIVLGSCALPSHAAAIRQSLRDDPVIEVKIAAIRVLRKLKDTASLDLLCSLVRGRSQETVTWYETGTEVDDWMDIRLAAIDALGHIGDARCIPSLLSAWDGAFKRRVEVPVFHALVRLKKPGIEVLIRLLSDSESGVSKNASDALLRAERPAVETWPALLEQTDGPDKRNFILKKIEKTGTAGQKSANAGADEIKQRTDRSARVTAS
jgi:HEAT repeat protein